MPPVFSVILPVYNGASTLSRTLECLVQQTFQDFEIVLVNDGSSDRSEAVIQNFIESHPQVTVQYISQKNKGLGGARNTALKEAAGSYFALIDQDDIWYPKKLERVLALFEQRPEISFVTHRLRRRVNGVLGDVIYSDSVEGDLFRKLLFDTNFLCGCAMSFRKAVIEKIGAFTEDRQLFHLSEDYDYWLRASASGLQFHLIEEVLGEYVIHAKNFSKNRQGMFRNEWHVVREYYKKRPLRKWWDPLLLGKRRGKILARQTLAFLGAA